VQLAPPLLLSIVNKIKVFSKNADIKSMHFDFSKINFDKAGIAAFFKEKGVQISATEESQINSIFDECDTEIGMQGQKGQDGKLNSNEAIKFLNTVGANLKHLFQNVHEFFVGFAKSRGAELPKANVLSPQQGINPSECLEDAKAIIEQNWQVLGLTEKELEFIKAAKIYYNDFGSAEAKGGELLVNENSPVQSKEQLIKKLIHEASHYSKSTLLDTWEEEYEVEKRALELTAKLIEKDKNDNIIPYGEYGVDILELAKDEKLMHEKLMQWLNIAYKNMPESLETAKTTVHINPSQAITFRKGDVVVVGDREFPIGEYFMDGVKRSSIIQLVKDVNGKPSADGVLFFKGVQISPELEEDKQNALRGRREPQAFVVLRNGKPIEGAKGIIYM